MKRMLSLKSKHLYSISHRHQQGFVYIFLVIAFQLYGDSQYNFLLKQYIFLEITCTPIPIYTCRNEEK